MATGIRRHRNFVRAGALALAGLANPGLADGSIDEPHAVAEILLGGHRACRHLTPSRAMGRSPGTEQDGTPTSLRSEKTSSGQGPTRRTLQARRRPCQPRAGPGGV